MRAALARQICARVTRGHVRAEQQAAKELDLVREIEVITWHATLALICFLILINLKVCNMVEMVF